jgi:hypothetical protein
VVIGRVGDGKYGHASIWSFPARNRHLLDIDEEFPIEESLSRVLGSTSTQTLRSATVSYLISPTEEGS